MNMQMNLSFVSYILSLSRKGWSICLVLSFSANQRIAFVYNEIKFLQHTVVDKSKFILKPE